MSRHRMGFRTGTGFDNTPIVVDLWPKRVEKPVIIRRRIPASKRLRWWFEDRMVDLAFTARRHEPAIERVIVAVAVLLLVYISLRAVVPQLLRWAAL